MPLEFLPIIGLIYVAVAGLYLQLSIRKSLQRLGGKELPRKIVKRFVFFSAIVHAYGLLYFLMRLAQSYFSQLSIVYFFFDALMLFVLLLLPIFLRGATKSIKQFEAMA